MPLVALGLGLILLATVLVDAFETMILPRRVTRRIRLTRFFYRATWLPWSAFARRLPDGTGREYFLSFFGPLSLILLLAVWAASLVVSFALLHWGFGTRIAAPEEQAGFGTVLYLSGSTFFTLGIGDVTPRGPIGRLLTVAEAAVGFAFLALVIGYLPVLYQSFSRREVNISLLDARAGSPPTAAELLRRQCQGTPAEALAELLRDWERWSAELLESHLSYPLLAYYRSQHERVSWLAALTTVLDTCALVIVGIDGAPARQARLTFAIARHAAVDLSQVFGQAPRAPEPDRLTPWGLAQLRTALISADLALRDGAEADRKLAALRFKYEPYVNALGTYLLMPLPPWVPAEGARDDWEVSAAEQPTPAGRRA
jgi:Ion channel